MSALINNVSCFLTTILLLRPITWCSSQQTTKKQPHIILILADDLGWNDVGFHGSIQIPTPNIDALAFNGIILNRHYVQPTCTPSRAALLSGKYPIRYGLQGTPIIAGQASALPLSEKILPQYLKDLGYSTHLVGKWHLGAYQRKFTPTERGFDTHFGYWNGFISYRNSTHSNDIMSGKDARRGFDRAGDEMINKYATDIFTEEAIKLIDSHKHQEKPMFLMVSHLAVHTGDPGPNLLEVANKTYNDEQFKYIKNKDRRLFAGMMTSLDNSVDNGAPADDPIWGYGNAGSNWPLRGEKGAVLEGGVRGVAAFWSSWLKKKHRISENLFHITDWLPTLYTAAGGDFIDLGQIDGIDQWNSLTESSKIMRSIALVNIDETRGEEALIFNQWKIVKSNKTSDIAYYLRYSGDPGDTGPDYNMQSVASSIAGSRLSKVNCRLNKEDCMDSITTYQLFYSIRSQARVHDKCSERISKPSEHYECFNGYCLFDLENDPCEYKNVAKQHPQVLNMTLDMMNEFKKELVKQNRPGIDPNSDPRKFNGYWETWLDHDETSDNASNSPMIILITVFVVYFLNLDALLI
ncbi:arylsulfatase B-like isoform X2 [Adelges cooleyi]|uniref:arylsulfatase B-like isoform X2 n=1 Tax=Adelges cooleyi TaxID=133065 RepID=UPI00217F2AE6|nr:arylsulfatase B-like isoform X2 [Adelges cooleyi]